MAKKDKPISIPDIHKDDRKLSRVSKDEYEGSEKLEKKLQKWAANEQKDSEVPPEDK